MKTRGQNIIALVLAILVLLAAGYTAAFGVGDFEGCFDKGAVTLGLDIAGGTSIMYSPAGEYEPTEEEMDAVIASLRARIDDLGYTEAQVYSSSSNHVGTQFNVDIPGESVSPDVIEKMSATAELTFQDYNGDVMLTGSDVDSASAQYGDQGAGVSSWYVSITLKDEAVSKFADATGKVSKYTGENNYLAICLDDAEVTAPRVTETLTQKDVMITGSFDEETAKYYAGVINAGALPFALEVEQTNAVTATLGQDALEKCLWAGLIGIILVMIFMVVIYRLPGVAAVLALSTYIVLTGFAIRIFNVNLSLAGIAGIVLAIGMAVDANVVIFERIKDELRAGRSTVGAVQAGFRNAMSAIFDSNITTLIAAVVLLYFGTGGVRGFAMTLLIGVVLSFVSAILITKFFINRLIRLGITGSGFYGVKEAE